MLLYGLHDLEGHHLVPPGGWCLDTIALTENPKPKDYKAIRSDINWIVRVNHGYGSTGTLPNSNGISEFIQKMVDHVLGCRGLTAYIMSNECNHENERPGGNILSPKYVANVFSQVRQAIRPLNSEVLAITTPIAPYHASPMDWLVYLKEYLTLVSNQGGADGIGLHAYVRGDKPGGVYSLAKMGPPLTGQSNSFRVYRDALSVVPSSLKKIPAFITECNTLMENGWTDENTGVVRAIYDEIDTWNGAVGTQKVYCVCLYRFPNYDKWYIEGKNGVIEDFKMAVSKGYSPEKSSTIHLPSVPNLPPAPGKPTPEAKIDPRAIERGVKIEEVNLTPGELGFKVDEIRWYNEQEADAVGPDHHILVDVVDENGKRIPEVGVIVNWPSGSAALITEAKPGELAAANFPMSPSRNEFSVYVEEYPMQSDKVTGIGMGMETPSGFNSAIHTDTYVRFKMKMGTRAVEKPKPPVAQTVPPLSHPVGDPKYKVITQRFGENPEDYERFKVDGVPLKGHNGVDFGTPEGTPVLAADTGVVIEEGNDPEGYGNYVKLQHSWGQTLYAHLRNDLVTPNMTVEKGVMIGLTGKTGNVTGPHLHFAMRVNPYNRADGWGGYSDPMPYLKQQETKPASNLTILEAIADAAEDFDLEYELLASLAFAESKFDVNAVSSAGAIGLFQIMPLTWNEWSVKVGVSDPYDAFSNAKVGAAYLSWCLSQTGGDRVKALVAYNWGLGNLQSGGEIPLSTRIYAYSVVHGADLLKAIGT